MQPRNRPGEWPRSLLPIRWRTTAAHQPTEESIAALYCRIEPYLDLGGYAALRRTALPAPRSGLRPRARGRASSMLQAD
jgi:hypothetical protein